MSYQRCGCFNVLLLFRGVNEIISPQTLQSHHPSKKDFDFVKKLHPQKQPAKARKLDKNLILTNISDSELRIKEVGITNLIPHVNTKPQCFVVKLKLQSFSKHSKQMICRFQPLVIPCPITTIADGYLPSSYISSDFFSNSFCLKRVCVIKLAQKNRNCTKKKTQTKELPAKGWSKGFHLMMFIRERKNGSESTHIKQIYKQIYEPPRRRENSPQPFA